MKVVFLLIVLAIGANCLPQLEDLETEWQNFKNTHKKFYKNAREEQTRKSIFAKNYQKVVDHNKLYEEKIKTYYMGINQFSDRTKEELKVLKGFKAPKNTVDDVYTAIYEPRPNEEIPESLDWRTTGAVSEVKDQGFCGSCWVFSATGALEGQYFLKTGKMRSLSEQNVVDCCHILEAVGCGGGWSSSAFVYVYINDGIDSEESYPYEAIDNICRYDVQYNVTSLRGYTNITYANEEHLLSAVATIGPISVAIDAETDGFDYYAGGVLYEENCLYEVNDLNHGVLVVGYGVEDGNEYWLVKNSWGENWGDSGYLKMARNKGNNCGIATLATFPNLY